MEMENQTTAPLEVVGPFGKISAWIDCGIDIMRQHSGVQWAIATWLFEGADEFGIKAYEEAEKITGMQRQTLYDFVVVAKSIDVSLRNYNLFFNHYRAVAKLDPAKQKEYLGRAVVGHLSVHDLRDLIESENTPPAPQRKSQSIQKLRPKHFH